MRGLLAVYVMWHHMMLTPSYRFLNPINRLIIDLFRYGHYAVDIFIVLSGYCLMLPVLETNYELATLKFYKRRFIRIYPTYFLAISISYLLIFLLINKKTGTIWDLSIPVNDPTIIVSHLFLIHDFFYNHIYRINYIFWSISVEARIYLLFPILLWFCRKWSVLTTFFLTCFLSFSMWILLMMLHKFYPSIDVSASGVHPFIILFAFGMLAANISLKKNDIKLPWIKILILSICVQTVLELFYKGTTIKDINLGICAMALLITIENQENNYLNLAWLKRVLSAKPMVFLGTYAYSIYLFHPLFIQILWQYFVNPLNLPNIESFYLLLLSGSPIILGICYVMYMLFERPFLKYLRKQKKEQILNLVLTEPAP